MGVGDVSAYECRLPHQRAVVDPADRAAATHVLATRRAELERRRRQDLDPRVPQLVLVVSELAQVAAEEDLRFLLTHGSEFQVRVVAATADTAIERDLLVDCFESRLVFALEDEEASTRLLGKPWALALGRAWPVAGAPRALERGGDPRAPPD